MSTKIKSILVAFLACSLVACASNTPATQESPQQSSEGSQASGEMADGTYSSKQTGHNAPMDISVVIEDGKIKNIETSHNETIGVGVVAIEQITDKILEQQNLAVDNISGATLTSAAFLRGASDCLSQAGADVDALSNKDNIVKEELNDSYDADVVVIGAGGAGYAAAISAQQNGAKVIILEKLGITGGSTNVSEGALNAVDDERQKAQGIEDSVEKFYTQTLTGGDNAGTPELVDYFTQNAFGAVEWMEDMGVEFKDEIGSATGSMWTRSHYPKTPSGNSYIRVFDKYVEDTDGIDLMLNTKATELIKKGDRIVGVKAVNGDKEVVINASKGVIIATGGFGANIEMRQEYNTVWDTLDSSIGCTNHALSATGDGIVMGQQVGAQLTGMEDIQLHPCGHPKTGLMVDIRTSGLNRIFVNSAGERFVAEDSRRDDLVNGIFAQENASYWIVCNTLRYPSRDFVDKNGATIENMVAQGNVIEADTLEQLAEKMGADPAKLVASIEQYNSVVDGTADPLGLKLFDKKMTEGPWYACAKVPTVHHTMGGLKIDTSARVLGENNEPINGLFAAGEVTGGIHGKNRLGGNAIADCMVFGKLAGEIAAKAE